MPLAIGWVFAGWPARRVVDRYMNRRGKAIQIMTPECFGPRLVLFLQPDDVITVGAGRRKYGAVVATGRLVQSQKLLEDQRHAPSIQQQMMMAPDELIGRIPQMDESDPHQW